MAYCASTVHLCRRRGPGRPRGYRPRTPSPPPSRRDPPCCSTWPPCGRTGWLRPSPGRLATAGCPCATARPTLTPAPDPAMVEQLAIAVADGPVVVRPDPVSPLAPADSRRLSAGLADLATQALAGVGGRVDLVLTGGETARRVLDALGVTRLTPLGQVYHGAVLSRLPGGASVVTRPGSFGSPDSLLSILAALHPLGGTAAPLMTASPRGSTKGTP